MTTQCPTCERDDFASRKGMRNHHARVHGESLLKTECDQCGDTFKKTNPDVSRFCSRECYAEWQSENTHGESNPNYSEKVERECKQCGEPIEHIPSIDTKFCSRSCYGDWLSKNNIGEDHPRYSGGYTYNYGENWHCARKAIRQRDSEVCQKCGLHSEERAFDVHHIKSIKEFDNPENANTSDNLILLCRQCHVQIERGETECPQPKERVEIQ